MEFFKFCKNSSVKKQRYLMPKVCISLWMMLNVVNCLKVHPIFDIYMTGAVKINYCSPPGSGKALLTSFPFNRLVASSGFIYSHAGYSVSLKYDDSEECELLLDAGENHHMQLIVESFDTEADCTDRLIVDSLSSPTSSPIQSRTLCGYVQAGDRMVFPGRYLRVHWVPDKDGRSGAGFKILFTPMVPRSEGNCPSGYLACSHEYCIDEEFFCDDQDHCGQGWDTDRQRQEDAGCSNLDRSLNRILGMGLTALLITVASVVGVGIIIGIIICCCCGCCSCCGCLGCCGCRRSGII